jgi:hypothetical protein
MIAHKQIFRSDSPEAVASNCGHPFSICWQYPSAIFPVSLINTNGLDCSQFSPAYCTACNGGISSMGCQLRIVSGTLVFVLDISSLRLFSNYVLRSGLRGFFLSRCPRICGDYSLSTRPTVRTSKQKALRWLAQSSSPDSVLWKMALLCYRGTRKYGINR